MLNHTKAIKEIYEGIQKKLYYMIPERWDIVYLYSSTIDIESSDCKGELYFYYIPKGIFRKNPVNVYEIPSKFNIDDGEFLKLIENLYDDIKRLRYEFKKSETGEIWSNITLSINNTKFRAEYGYEDLANSKYNSYEHHIIWRYIYLGIGPEQVSKDDKEILVDFIKNGSYLQEQEEYISNVYVDQDIKNIIEYHTMEDEIENDGYIREDEQDDEDMFEKKYNQIKTQRFENNWDHRKKRKDKFTKKVKQEINKEDEFDNKFYKNQEINLLTDDVLRPKPKKNQILFSEDENEQ